MKKSLLFLVCSIFLLLKDGYCQEQYWSLEKSVQYALDHNIDLRKSVLNERLAQLQLQQLQLSQIPNTSLSANYGKSLGRSVDPTTNQFINSNYDFAGLNGNVDVLLFGWFQKRKTIHAGQLSLKAAKADYDQLQDDISLNIATAYLRILLAQENIAIAKHQIEFSNKQKLQTEAFVNAGRLPEIELLQMEAQVATDSSTYFTAQADFDRSLLDIKAMMNLDIATPFLLASPEIKSISYEEILKNTPEEIYQIAKNNFSSIKSNAFKVEAAQKTLAARRAALYPQLGIGFQLGTNYSSTLREFSDFKVVGSEPTGNFIDVNGTPYPVLQPTVDFSSKLTPFFTQLNNNFRQTIALSLSIPLFNGWVGRTSVYQSKVDLENNILEQERTTNKLKQDVYGAYYDAQAAIKKYDAAQKAAKASEKALDFAQKRYELGLMNAVELLTTQNTNFKSQSNAASAKYDLFFKLKVIDYYLGKQLTL